MNNIFTQVRDGLLAKTLTAYGCPVTIKAPSSSNYNPSTGTVTSGCDLMWDTVGLETDYDIRDIDGTVIRRGDKRYMLLAKESIPDPTPNCKLVVGTKIWNVINCSPIAPAGVAIAYDIQVRQ